MQVSSCSRQLADVPYPKIDVHAVEDESHHLEEKVDSLKRDSVAKLQWNEDHVVNRDRQHHHLHYFSERKSLFGNLLNESFTIAIRALVEVIEDSSSFLGHQVVPLLEALRRVSVFDIEFRYLKKL